MLYLVRHGSAGVRDDADPADTERHLDSTGLRQAVTVAERLAEAGVTAVLASPAARCVETIEPLAAAVGLPVDIDGRLFEGTDIESTWSLVEALVEHDEVAVLPHEHHPRAHPPGQGPGMEVPGKAGCSKGSLWTLEWDGERFATGTYETLR